MQRLIAKYGLAAHLALAAVAPLFLFPFFDESVIAVVMLWLSLYAAVWTMLEPSIRGGERLHDARSRVMNAVVHDPFAWTLLALTVVAGVQAFNGGIRMAYDAETLAWSIAKPQFPILPGTVDGCADLMFAGSVLLLVVLLACRHALGKSARMVFLFIASLLAGVAATAVVFAANQGHAASLAAINCTTATRSFTGAVFGVYMMAGTVALVFGVERNRLRAVPAFLLAIGGSAAGLVAFAPAYVIVVFTAAELVVAGYAFVFALVVLKGSCELKFFIFFLAALGFGALLVMSAMPRAAFDAKLAAIVARDFFPIGFEHTRTVLSDISFRVWKEHLWIGSGFGSYPLDIRFFAVAKEWAAIPPGTITVPNAGWQLLAERGIVGALQLAVPFGFLVFTYLSRFVRELRGRHFPHPACFLAPFATAAAVATAWFDCSLLRVDLLLALCAAFALSANSFHKEKR